MATVYRIIKYEGDNDWLDQQLDASIRDGIKIVNKRGDTITAATVDPLDLPTIEFCRDRCRHLVAKLSSPVEYLTKPGWPK